MSAQPGLRHFAWLLACAPALTGCFSTLPPPADAAALVAREHPTASTPDWSDVLEKHVDAQGLVDYAGLAQHRENLDRFVARLAVIGPHSTPEIFPTADDRLAFYLNAYNALVVFNVLAHMPLSSFAENESDFFYFTRLVLDRREISLYDLQNDVIRGHFHDPRVHMALCCGRLDCARLAREPFSGAALPAQLAAATARFLHEPRNVSVEDDVLVLSPLFEQYADDFRPDAPAWIRAQAPDLQLPADLPVRYQPPDTGLDIQPAEAAP